MASDAIALVVVGTGEVTEAEVNDMLDDAYGGVEELGLVVPVDKDLYTDAVKCAVDWYNNDKDVFTVATKGATAARGTKNLGDPDEDTDEVDSLVEYLKPEEFEGWDEVHVLIAMPEESDEDEYDFYAEIADAASAAGFTVKDLTAGLDDIVVLGADEDPEAEPEPEPEPVKEEPPKRSRSRKKAEPVEEKDPVEVIKAELRGEEEPPAPVEPKDGISESQKIIDAYHYLKGVHEALGVALEALAMTPVLDPSRNEPTETPEPAKEEPKASGRGRGRPRTRFEVKQVWDEDDEAWVPRPAGRLSKGTKWRTVHAETDEVLDEGTA